MNEIMRHKQQLAAQIHGIYNDLEKGVPVGTVNAYGKTKMPDGTWKYVGKGKQGKKEEPGEHKVSDSNDNKEKSVTESKRPTPQEFDKARLLGSGLEGTVREVGDHAVKATELKNVDLDKLNTIKELIKNPDEDFIQFNDSWVDSGKLYVSMQKVSRQQMDDVYTFMSKDRKAIPENHKHDYMHLINEAAKEDKPFPKELGNEKDLPYLSFMYRIGKKGLKDVHPQNMAIIDGKPKAFDWMSGQYVQLNAKYYQEQNK